MSVKFDITTGVRQGDVLAPFLLSLLFYAVICATMSTHPSASVRILYSVEGPLVGSRRKMTVEVSVSDLEYVDDMALVSDLIDVAGEGSETAQQSM